MKKMNKAAIGVLGGALAFAVHADTVLKPFTLAETTSGDVPAIAKAVAQKLTAGGFEVVGEYQPYAGADILVVTDDALKQAAAKTDFGAFGAAQRVTVTKVGDAVQVAYTNPVYMSDVYRMSADLSGEQAHLAKVLGAGKPYGPAKGLTAKELRGYHYKFLMPYFDDRVELAEYKDYPTAVAKVEAALAAGSGGTAKVYRIDVPGKQESVFGVKMTTDCSGDKYIMSRIDFKPTRSTGHLPYDMVVRGRKVYTLPAEFRIAINFPDLSMMGSNSFASIMCAPDAIKKALTAAAGEKVKKGGLF